MSVLLTLHYLSFQHRIITGNYIISILPLKSSESAQETAEGMAKSNKNEVRKQLRLAVQKLDARGHSDYEFIQ